MHRRHDRWLAALAAVGLLAATACSSSGNVASPAPSNPTTAAQQAAPSQVASPRAADNGAQSGAVGTPTPPPQLPTKAPAASPAASPSAAAAYSGPTVTVSGAFAQTSAVQGAVYVAADLGFFAQNGINFKISQIGGNAQVAALGAGDIQFGALGANEVANADVGGANLVMIATCSDYPIFSLFANKKYQSVQDLAGQTIAVTNAGSATDAAAHLFVAHFNMTGKIKIVPSGGTIPAVFAALTQGNVAGAILSPPTTQKAADAGYTELVNGAKLGVPMNHSAIAVTRSYLQQHRDVVLRFLKAYQEAWTYSANPANKAKVLQVLEKYTKTNAQLATVGYNAMMPIWTGVKSPTVNPTAVKNLLDLSTNAKVKSTDPNSLIDNSLLQSVAGGAS